MFKLDTQPYVPMLGEIIQLEDSRGFIGGKDPACPQTFPRFIKTKTTDELKCCDLCMFGDFNCAAITNRVSCYIPASGMNLYFVECTEQGDEDEQKPEAYYY